MQFALKLPHCPPILAVFSWTSVTKQIRESDAHTVTLAVSVAHQFSLRMTVFMMGWYIDWQ